MMPEQADENTIALSNKFEASKLPNDTTYLPVFVIERISLLVRADQVLYSEYRSTEGTTRGTRSGAVLLITSDSVVTVDFKDVKDGLQRRRDAPVRSLCSFAPPRTRRGSSWRAPRTSRRSS